jgi:hypothetical protein
MYQHASHRSVRCGSALSTESLSIKNSQISFFSVLVRSTICSPSVTPSTQDNCAALLRSHPPLLSNDNEYDKRSALEIKVRVLLSIKQDQNEF